MKKYKTLILMPYLPIEGLIKFSGLKIWSYQKLNKLLIKDSILRDHLDKLIGCYQFQKGNKIQNPAIISVNKISFNDPNRSTAKKIEVLKSVMLVLGILENNNWSFVSSDNFEVFYQRFNVGDINLSTQSGAIHRISTGGYKIGEIAFVKPDYVHLPLNFRPDVSILRALEDCLINSNSSTDKSQIIQSLSPLFTAYRNSHEHSWQVRILLLVMAFELLFGETERENFRKNIQKYSTLGVTKQEKTYKYTIFSTKTGAIIAEEQLTLNQIWAEEFYKLRHKIIHGNTTYSDDFIFKDLLSLVKPKEPHFYIAVNFFIVCLLNKLREIGFSNVPNYAIDPESSNIYVGKNISGIKNEVFKIIRVNPFG